jgi:hypothetical protein
MNTKLMRKVANVPQSLDASMNDLLDQVKDESPVGISEGYPSVSVGAEDVNNGKDAIMVTFNENAGEITKATKADRNGKIKEYQWTEVTMQSPHEGYDSKDKKSVQLKKGDIATINLLRHANLASWVKSAGELKGRTFIIGTMGVVKTAKGNRAMDYRIKEVDAPA